AMIFALLAMMFAFFAFIVAAQADSKKSSGVPAGAVQVTLSEFAINPSTIQVPLDGKLVVTNAGAVAHNFHVDKTNVHTSDLSSGDTATVDLKGVEAGSYTVYCAVSGHRDAGMQATLVVGGTGGASGSAAGMANMDFNSMSPQQLQAMNDQMDTTMKHAVDVYT